jgi:hypothetical protein
MSMHGDSLDTFLDLQQVDRYLRVSAACAEKGWDHMRYKVIFVLICAGYAVEKAWWEQLEPPQRR